MLPDTIFAHILLFLAGFIALTAGATFLVRGASRLAARFNVSAVVIGLTIVAFGTSLPEFLVSIVANLQGNGEIAIGNIVGSNIANFGLIIGSAALLAPLPVERHLLRREYPLLIFFTLLFTLLGWNGTIGRIEGMVLAAGLFAITYMSYSAVRQPLSAEAIDASETLEVVESIDPTIGRPSTNLAADVVYMILGLAGLVFGANWLVTAAEFIAREAGVSELVIGLTLVAVGTSLPELATTVVAVWQKEPDIAFGNAVGSNLFNMLFIGGFNALVNTMPVPPRMFVVDFPVMNAMTILVFLMIVRDRKLGRVQGGLILAAYLAYTIYLFLTGSVEG